MVHTFNNVIENILHWLLSTKRNDQKISNYINRQIFKLEDESPDLTTCELFRYIFFIKILN